MNRRPPSIRSLVAFEAVARLQSVSRAADELCITQAAASIRIKGLEEHLGFALFSRENGQIRLTQAGSRYLGTVREVIDRLAKAAEWAGRPASAVRLTVFNAFAQHWLMPRFGRLMRELADIEVSLIVDDERDAPPLHETDLAIHLADAAPVPDATRPPAMKLPAAKLLATKLLDDELVAICRPDFQARHRLSEPRDLDRVTLLVEQGEAGTGPAPSDTALWLRRAGLDPARIDGAIGFRDAALLIDAALHRVGVALVRRSLVMGEIEEGRLTIPFDLSVQCRRPVWLAVATAADDNVCRVRDWLLAEAQTTLAQTTLATITPPAMRLQA